jgi:hypothetical protein
MCIYTYIYQNLQWRHKIPWESIWRNKSWCDFGSEAVGNWFVLFQLIIFYIRRRNLAATSRCINCLESCFTTGGQSASLSWNTATIWGLRPHFYYCQTVAGLLMWGALSDERKGLSFTIATGLRQCSHFRVRLQWDSWPYFTDSDSRLPFSSPPTTRRVTVEVFDPTSTREFYQLQRLFRG